MLIKFQQLVRIEVQMSLNLLRNRQPSLQQSRVSSSSSNHSQSYELIPRQEAYFNPTRDVISPRASFPFRKVQGGIESSLANKINNDSRSSIKGSVKDVNDSKDLLEDIGELNGSIKVPENNQNQREGSEQSANDKQFRLKIQELRKKIEQLQKTLQQQRNEYDLQKKANEIYTQGFFKIRQLILTKRKLDGESIEQLGQKLAEILSTSNEGNNHEIINQQDKKIRQLRAQLLKSTQNNINAIFNTQISEAYCLQHQIQKMNIQIMNLKEKLIKASAESQQNMTKMLQNKSNSSEIKKIIKIYQQRLDSESEGEEIGRETNKRNRSNKNKIKKSRSSSSSEKSSNRNKRLKSTENNILELIQGYKQLKAEYARIVEALKQVCGSQTDFKELFSILKKDFTFALQTQIKEVKETIKRPSSNHQQLKIAKQIQSKLNDLVNTLNAPEKVNVEKSIEEQERHENVETLRKLSQLEAKNLKQEQELRALNEEKNHLQDTIMNMSKFYLNKNQMNQLCIESVEQKRKKSSKKGEQIEEFMLTSRSDLKQQHINEQLSVGQTNGPVVHTSSFNKLHSSQSYHQSSSKNTEIENLYIRIQRYEQVLRQKQLRITELQNTIIDHLESRTYTDPLHHGEKEMKQKYELYINNLKMLLNQSRREYDVLKKQLIKSSEMSLSRANNDQDRNSITLSDRTTKNCIAQTRLIQRRPPKTNSFESIKAKLQVEDALEKAFASLLQFAQKIIMYQQVSRITVIDSVINCLKQLILEAKQRNCKLYEDTINNEDILKRLRNIGIELS